MKSWYIVRCLSYLIPDAEAFPLCMEQLLFFDSMCLQPIEEILGFNLR